MMMVLFIRMGGFRGPGLQICVQGTGLWLGHG